MRPPFQRAGGVRTELPGAAPAPVTTTGAANIQSDGGTALMSMADRVRRMADRQHDAADEEARRHWASLGFAEGAATPGVQMDGGGALVRDAYNQQAQQASLRQLEISARDRLDALSQEHAADPAAFDIAARSYREGMVRGMPQELAARIGQSFDILARPVFNQVQARARGAAQDQSVATFSAAQDRRIASVERLAGQALSDPDAGRALDQEIGNIRTEIARMGPRAGFTLDGVTYPPDPSRADLPVTRLVPQLEAAQRAITRAGVLAWSASNGHNRAAVDALDREVRGITADATQQRMDGAASFTDQHRAVIAPGLTPQRDVYQEAEVRRLQGVLREAAGDPQRQAEMPVLREAIVLMSGQPLRNPSRPRPGSVDGVAGQWDEGTAAPTGRINVGAPAARALVPEALRDALRGIPASEREGIFSELRANAARVDAELRASQAQARAALQDRLLQNRVAIDLGQIPPHRWTDADARAAGLDPPALRADEAAGQARYEARQAATAASTPEQLAEIGARFAPGTPEFAADPRAAAALLNSLRERGVQVANATITQRILDLTGVAQTTGRVEAEISEAEGRSAGMPAWEVERVNQSVRLEAELFQRRQFATTLPPDQRAAAMAELQGRAESGEADARRLRAYADAFRDRDAAVARDPAGFALGQSPHAQALLERVRQNDGGALPLLVTELRSEQTRMGITAAQPLPEALAQSLVQGIATSTDANGLLARLGQLRAAVGDQDLARLLATHMTSGPQAAERRQALAVAALTAERAPGLAREIAAGVLVLRDTPVPGLTATALAADADRTLGNALSAPEHAGLRDQAIAAARAIYAARQSAAGAIGGGYRSGVFREALGQLVPTVRIGGRDVPLNPGQDGAQLRALLADMPAAALDGALAADGRAITPEALRQGTVTLQPVGPAQYRVQLNGFDVLARDADGRPDMARAFVLDVRGLSPAAGRAARMEDAPSFAILPPASDAAAPLPAPLPPAAPAPPRDPNAPVGAAVGIRPEGGITNEPVGRRLMRGGPRATNAAPPPRPPGVDVPTN